MDELDATRGAAFVLMLANHAALFWNLGSTGAPLSPALDACGALARYTFILVAGVALARQFRASGASGASGASRTAGGACAPFLRRRLARCLEVGVHALVVSCVTYLAVPDLWVRFGVLHFLAVSLALTAALLCAPAPLGALGALALLLAPRTGLAYLDLATGAAPAHSALDYFPLRRWLPTLWLGVLLGMSTDDGRAPLAPLSPLAPLAALGRNTLPLYTAHFTAMCLAAAYARSHRP
jgi:uncharacterized membrane protein